MTGVRSFLSRHQPCEPASADELERMRRAAWRKQGVVMLRPEDIADDFLRQALINLAVARYGPRDTAERAAG